MNMIRKSLRELYQAYDAFFVDVYGVLYDGSGFFEGVLDLLRDIKNDGKRIIILSNTTIVADLCKVKYSKKGLIENIHYDKFISSGEAFKQTLNKHISGAKTYFSVFHPNVELFQGSGLVEVDTIEKADFVYIGYLNSQRVYAADNLKDKSGKTIPLDDLTSTDCHDIAEFEAITDILDKCLELNKTLVVANPDLFALEAITTNEGSERRPILCQGAVGEFYERMGGKVIYFGKPYSAVYDFAKQFVSKDEKVAMIGDTIWTDILGGNMAGVDSVLTLTGVSGEFLKSMSEELSIEEKIDLLIKGVSKKMTHKSLAGFSQVPTHIVESFA